jgi:hypothetical protein
MPARPSPHACVRPGGPPMACPDGCRLERLDHIDDRFKKRPRKDLFEKQQNLNSTMNPAGEIHRFFIHSKFIMTAKAVGPGPASAAHVPANGSPGSASDSIAGRTTVRWTRSRVDVEAPARAASSAQGRYDAASFPPAANRIAEKTAVLPDRPPKAPVSDSPSADRGPTPGNDARPIASAEHRHGRRQGPAGAEVFRGQRNPQALNPLTHPLKAISSIITRFLVQFFQARK